MKKAHPLFFVSIGVAIGAGIGVAMHNIAVGAGIGVALGCAFMAANSGVKSKK